MIFRETLNEAEGVQRMTVCAGVQVHAIVRLLGISRRQFHKAGDVLRLQTGFELGGRQRGREKEFRFLGAPLLAAFAEWAELHNGQGSESASADE